MRAIDFFLCNELNFCKVNPFDKGYCEIRSVSMMNHYYYNQGRSSMGQEGSVWVFLSPSQITHKGMLHKKLTPISPLFSNGCYAPGYDQPGASIAKWIKKKLFGCSFQKNDSSAAMNEMPFFTTNFATRTL